MKMLNNETVYQRIVLGIEIEAITITHKKVRFKKNKTSNEGQAIDKNCERKDLGHSPHKRKVSTMYTEVEIFQVTAQKKVSKKEQNLFSND